MSHFTPIPATRLSVGLGWKPALSGVEPDLDASVFMLSNEGKLPDTEFFVFYNNLQSIDQAVEHLGDATKASGGQSDEETIQLDLSRVDKRIHTILFVVTVHEGEKYGHHFGMVKGAYIRLMDRDQGTELLRYALTEDFATETAVAFAQIQRKATGWEFEPLGVAQSGGLAAFVNRYN